MQAIAALVKWIDGINRNIGKAISFLLIPMIFITAYEVIMRYCFKSPTIWGWELNMQFWAFIVLFSGGYAFLENSHVRVDVVYNLLNEKKRAILNIVACLLIMSCMVLVIKYGLNMGIESLLKGEKQSTVWGSPMYTIRMFIPIGGLLLFLQGLSELIKDICTLRGIKLDLLPDTTTREGE